MVIVQNAQESLQKSLFIDAHIRGKLANSKLKKTLRILSSQKMKVTKTEK